MTRKPKHPAAVGAEETARLYGFSLAKTWANLSARERAGVERAFKASGSKSVNGPGGFHGGLRTKLRLESGDFKPRTRRGRLPGNDLHGPMGLLPRDQGLTLQDLADVLPEITGKRI